MSQLVLKLFISGDNPQQQRAAADLKAHCEEQLKRHCDLEVIDVARQPQRAEEERVLATPALVKVRPLPVQHMIGDFSSVERVLRELGLGAAVELEQGSVGRSSHGTSSDCDAHGH